MGIVNEYSLKALTNKLIQADNIPIISNRGDNISSVISNIEEECESIKNPMTMKLENTTNIFSIGQGVNADVSKDVVTGKVEVELKGKTYQNLTSSRVRFEKSDASSYEIEVKDKSTRVTYKGGTQSWKYWKNDFNKNLLKPSTEYTVIIKIIGNPQLSNMAVCIQAGNSTGALTSNVEMENIGDDIWIAKLTTKSSLVVTDQVLYFSGGCTKFINQEDWIEFYHNMVLLEGDYTQIPIGELPPYFEGIQSSFEDGIVDIEVTGKNLVQHETYNKKKIPLNITEPLRSLPNGTCDEIRNNNGQWELVRRVGKVVLDGSSDEEWSLFDGNTNASRGFFIPLWKSGQVFTKPLNEKYTQLICSNLAIMETIPSKNNTAIHLSYFDNNENKIIICDNNNKFLDIASFITYLKTTPTTVYYELATPVITPIEPISFDVKSLSTMSINSSIAPTSTHSVELNRTAQIERCITEIANLKNRVDILEQSYNSHFIETQYKLSLLNMDYELEREEV